MQLLATKFHPAIHVHRYETTSSINTGSTLEQKAQSTDPRNLISPSSYYIGDIIQLLKLSYPTALKKTQKLNKQIQQNIQTAKHAHHASGKASEPKLTGRSEPSQSSVVLVAVPNDKLCHGVEFRHTHRQFRHGFGFPLH